MTSTTASPPAPTAALSPQDGAVLQAVLADWAKERGALLPVLHALQEALGYIPPAAVAPIAHALNLSRAEVHGVISYYHDFRTSAPAAHRLQICRAEACQAMGGQALLDHARTRLNCPEGQTSADGRYSVEAAYCLGLCACAPALVLDGQLHARMSAAQLDALLAGIPSTSTAADSGMQEGV